MEGRQRDGMVWRMLPVWLLAGVMVGGASGSGQCWVHPSCQDLDSESSMMECVELCRADVNAETPVVPGDDHLRPPPEPESTPSTSQAKRSYSMEHFRWGKPVGRKRRPIKVYTSNGVGEESAEVYPGEMRRQLAEEAMAAAAAADEDKEQGVSQEVAPGGAHQKKNGAYQMKHFRWSDPPASKRYGGFMRSWDEHSQRPLLTLFKNVINKDGQQQK